MWTRRSAAAQLTRTHGAAGARAFDGVGAVGLWACVVRARRVARVTDAFGAVVHHPRLAVAVLLPA